MRRYPTRHSAECDTTAVTQHATSARQTAMLPLQPQPLKCPPSHCHRSNDQHIDTSSTTTPNDAKSATEPPHHATEATHSEGTPQPPCSCATTQQGDMPLNRHTLNFRHSADIPRTWHRLHSGMLQAVAQLRDVSKTTRHGTAAKQHATTTTQPHHKSTIQPPPLSHFHSAARRTITLTPLSSSTSHTCQSGT